MDRQELKLGYIKITPELIETVNSLQTGGTIGWNEAPEEKYFHNEGIKSMIDDITEVSDFLVDVYSHSPELFEDGQFSNFLVNLRYLKTLFNGLAAPQQKSRQ